MNIEILNRYIELIDKGYCEDCNELNCIGNFPQKEIAENIKAILEENRKLKSTLELYKGSLHREHEAIHKANDLEEENQELKKQQKEFIKWLENESKEVIRDAGYHQRICLEILDKYKEIIGGDNIG